MAYAPVDPLRTRDGTKKTVAYFYDSDIGNYAYPAPHPMKPHRIRLAHSLIMNYELYKNLEIYRAKPASNYEMTQFHTDEYIDFLRKVTPDNMESYSKEQGKFNVGDDCPVFDGLFEFCGISGGGSMEGAARLNRQKCDIAVNWAGGLHHAKKNEASGFCYVNDIVLGILELLRFHQRVLYIDIDVHHGDGVEEAFYTTDRVMTVSFHKYGEFFPGTGELRDIGVGTGKYYSVNFPLRDGINDRSYKAVFEPVIKACMDYYKPEAIVLQCGGDSLSGDRLGCFNLSMRGHANCVDYVKSFDKPTLVLGGGGYTMRNVARTWAFETGVLLDKQLGPALPYNDYYEYYAPDYELDVRPSNMDNANTPEYLEKIKTQVIENIRRTMHAPSVQQTAIPPEISGMDEDMDKAADDADEDLNPDTRYTERRFEKYREHDGELSDTEEFGKGAREANGVRRQPGRRRMNIMDYQNKNPAPDDDEIVEQHGRGATNGDAPPAAAESTMNGIGTNAVEPKSERVSAEPNAGGEDVEMGEGNDAEGPAPAATGLASEQQNSGQTAVATAGAAVQTSTSTVVDGPQGATPPASPPATPSVTATIAPTTATAADATTEPTADSLADAAPSQPARPTGSDQVDAEMADADTPAVASSAPKPDQQGDHADAAAAANAAAESAKQDGVAEREADNAMGEQTTQLAEEAEEGK